MKKSLLIILLTVVLVMPVFANGMWVAGSVSYENTNTKNGANDSSSTTWSADPEIGYVFNKRWSGGVIVNYSSSQNIRQYAGIDFAGEDNIRTIGAAPFVKYKFLIIGKFTAFIKGKIFYSNTKVDAQDMTINSYGIAVLPVIDYKLTDTWSACAALNFASIGYSHSAADTTGDPSTDEFGFKVGNGSLFSVGLVYHF